MIDRDDDLRRRYREAATEEPSATLDQAILASARRAVAPRPSRQRWAVPASLAAVLVLALGITLRMQQERPGIETSSPASEYPVTPAPADPPAAAPPTAATAPPPVAPSESRAMDRAAQARQSKPDAETLRRVEPKSFADKPALAQAPAPAAPASAPSTAATPAPAASPAAPPAPPPAAAEAFPGTPPPAPRAELRGAAPPAIPPQPASPATAHAERSEAQPPGPVAKSQRKDTSELAAAATPQVRSKREQGFAADSAREADLDAREKELRRIAVLRREGRHAEADEALRKFQRENPGYRIPEATWETVKPR